MIPLYVDFETRSPVDLRKSGVYVYAEHPRTDVLCMAYAFGDEKAALWKHGESLPGRVAEHVAASGELVAHNAQFERVIWKHVCARYGWPVPALEQWRCTMAQAYAMSLPGSLDHAAAAVGLNVRKDEVGYRVMMQISKPRKVGDDGTLTWWDDPKKFEQLHAYCIQDVEIERQLDRRLMRLSTREREVWVLDQRINDRGVMVDVALCRQASKIVYEATKKLDRDLWAATNGAVGGVNQTEVLKTWVRSRGVDVGSIDKEHLAELLGLDLPSDVERALLIRQEAAKASTAKIATLLNGVSKDGRARGLLQYHGASTGRWAGRRFQPQNLPRPEMADPEEAIPILMTGDLRAVELFYDKPLSVVSDCLRSMVSAGA